MLRYLEPTTAPGEFSLIDKQPRSARDFEKLRTTHPRLGHALPASAG